MTTYWLIGKRDFAYSIDLDDATEKVRKAQYWKTSAEQEAINSIM